MKYVPLVWAAIMRKPTRFVLTLLSVMLAFTLFGLTIGMNATFAKLKDEARDDRLFAFSRFGGTLSVGMERQIESIPGVALVTSGYHMPRALMLARRGDLNVGAFPTDWRAPAAIRSAWDNWVPSIAAMAWSSICLREHMALLLDRRGGV